MEKHPIVSKDEWLVARQELLQKEKEFTRQRDQLSRQRRALPWVKVEKSYLFESPNGQEILSELFDGRSQLLVYHFMFGLDWDEGCISCSFWADNFDGIDVHLRHRDVTLVVISKAPMKKLQSFKTRMGWSFKWVSSFANEFNHDYHVSFTPEEMEMGEMYYNYRTGRYPREELPGISVFYKDEKGTIFHTYSTFSRGLDMVNGAYHFLDLVPKGAR